MKSKFDLIPFLDLKNQYKQIKKEIDVCIENVLEGGSYILGTEVKGFEEDFKNYIGVKYSFGVASGTDALTLSLKSLDLKDGDEVIMPANVYPTAFGVALSGVKIILCDVDPDTLNISAKSFENSITKNTKVVIVVHLYGNPVDLGSILRVARKYKIKVIEDCAQAMGAEYKGKKVGSFGDLAAFSFYPTKNLGAYGDSGMVVTNNKKYAEKLSILRMYGEVDRYNSILIGHNSRLDELQAAILRVKLKYLDSWNKNRRILSEYYIELLKDCENINFIKETKNANSVFHLFVILVKNRSELRRYLDMRGIQTAVHYPVNIYNQQSFKNLKKVDKDFLQAAKAVNSILSLPIYPELTKDKIKYICNEIKMFYKLNP